MDWRHSVNKNAIDCIKININCEYANKKYWYLLKNDFKPQNNNYFTINEANYVHCLEVKKVDNRLNNQKKL